MHLEIKGMWRWGAVCEHLFQYHVFSVFRIQVYIKIISVGFTYFMSVKTWSLTLRGKGQKYRGTGNWGEQFDVELKKK